MIFVTVGNATQHFWRLLNAVDSLKGEGFFKNETVFIQTGNNIDFEPRHCEHKPFLTMDEFKQRIEEADLIICHGGCGTLLHAVRLGKIPVVMPRRKQYAEHINDHQVQVVEALAEQGRVIAALEPEDLPKAIAEVQQRAVVVSSAQPPPMLNFVRKAIQDLIGGI